MLTDSYTTASFADKNVGAAKPVSVSGISISGADAGNYTVNTTTVTSANILAASLTVVADNQSKTYDGQPFSAFTAYYTGFVNGENAASAGVVGSPGFGGNAIGAIAAGSYTITPNAGTLTAPNYVFTSFTSGTLSIASAELVFTTQPSGIIAGHNISPAVVIALEDNGGHVVTTYSSLVTMSVATGAGPFTTGSTVTVAAVNGVATFTNLSLSASGGYLIQAGDGFVTSANSSPFVVVPDVASKLAVFQQPSNATAGVAISPAMIVDVVDQFGNLVTTNTSTVTISVATGPSTTFDAASKLAVAASGGIATFSKLILDTAGSYTLSAADGSLAAATSGSFTVGAAAASKLAITTQPSNVTAGAAITPAITVAIQDKYGNLATTNSSTVTVAVAAGPTTTFDASSTVSAAASGGIATLSNVILDKAGSYTLKFSDGTLTKATSLSFTVSAAAASQLALVNQPSNATAGVAISPAITVAVQDMYGNTETTDSSTVTVGVATGPTTTFDAFSTLSAAASGGIATLSNVILDKAGSYTLKFSDGALTAAISSSFTVSAAAASQLGFVKQPSNTTAGAAISPAITVYVLDKFDNLVTGNSSRVTIAVASGPITSFDSRSTLSVAASAGIATFSNLILDTAGSYMLKASDGSLTVAYSSSFTVSAAAASQLVFISQPSRTVHGQVINPAPQVAVEDQYRNIETTDNSTQVVVSGSNLTGTTTVTVVNGIATFNNLIITVAGSSKLTASKTGLTSATSVSFTVT